ncbi:hypothetical protein AQJ30_15670 [Streptomyces longwoodensis]|uniref:Uncharacterized protein n=1 Tax=Streptomyces longwoodensis TaxID=68231 RepID=A0A117QN96_9ACTN|nr:hypothetical protein [Streptomyces longwoodensis]KUN37721.1 hypothetical protein AQJ30_15670 [Streptomyces longwoodensis]
MSAYLLTTRRLMTLARVVRGRAYHPHRYLIDALAGAIEDAAIALTAYPVDEPGQLPQEAADALAEATEMLTRDDFMVPVAVLGYATAPVTGALPTMRPLTTSRDQVAAADRDLRARRLALVELGHLSSRDDDVMAAAFTGLIKLHRQHDRLAAAVATDLRRHGSAPTTS